MALPNICAIWAGQYLNNNFAALLSDTDAWDCCCKLTVKGLAEFEIVWTLLLLIWLSLCFYLCCYYCVCYYYGEYYHLLLLRKILSFVITTENIIICYYYWKYYYLLLLLKILFAYSLLLFRKLFVEDQLINLLIILRILLFVYTLLLFRMLVVYQFYFLTVLLWEYSLLPIQVFFYILLILLLSLYHWAYTNIDDGNNSENAS